MKVSKGSRSSWFVIHKQHLPASKACWQARRRRTRPAWRFSSGHPWAFSLLTIPIAPLAFFKPAGRWSDIICVFPEKTLALIEKLSWHVPSPKGVQNRQQRFCVTVWRRFGLSMERVIQICFSVWIAILRSTYSSASKSRQASYTDENQEKNFVQRKSWKTSVNHVTRYGINAHHCWSQFPPCD